MTESSPVELFLEVNRTDTDVSERDQLTRQLLAEIEEINVESARLAPAENMPEGAKGDAVTVGTILVSVLPAVVPKLVETINSWINRESGRVVKYKGQLGDTTFEFEGSSKDLQALLKSMEKTGKRSSRTTRLSKTNKAASKPVG